MDPGLLHGLCRVEGTTCRTHRKHTILDTAEQQLKGQSQSNSLPFKSNSHLNHFNPCANQPRPHRDWTVLRSKPDQDTCGSRKTRPKNNHNQTEQTTSIFSFHFQLASASIKQQSLVSKVSLNLLLEHFAALPSIQKNRRGFITLKTK